MVWQFDPAHSNIPFSAKHMMITTVRDHFDRWSGAIELDEQSPQNSHVEVTIEAVSLDTNQPEQDAHLKSLDFLNVEQYPSITFKSTRVEPSSRTAGKVYGNLGKGEWA